MSYRCSPKAAGSATSSPFVPFPLGGGSSSFLTFWLAGPGPRSPQVGRSDSAAEAAGRPCGSSKRHDMSLTEASAVTKCTEAVKNHPNTRGVPLGPFRGWCSQLFLEDATFRTMVAAKNGNALADAACGAVEAYSAKKGKP